MSENTFMNGNNEDNPTNVEENIVNDDFNDTINAIVSPPTEDGEYEDMTDTMFNELSTRFETGYDWSVNYELKYVDALTTYAAEFYEQQQQQQQPIERNDDVV